MSTSFSSKLLRWYRAHGRHDLPWQKNQTAYRVWISEIMLQQTQVTTVIPYYDRFVQRFPSVFKLADAKEDDVLAHWSGLGYYARARNMHKTAKIVAEKYQGDFPTTVEAMAELPGIGLSTAGAIISFSQKKKAVILDGNVKRVLARVFAIDNPVTEKKTVEKMWQLAAELTPNKNASDYNQAIMDLGATLCTRSKPNCHRCPFQSDCLAYQKNKSTFYPVKIAKKARPIKKTNMLIIHRDQKNILLVKRPNKGIWGGLWSFPENDAATFLNWKLKSIHNLPEITHQFTHFTLIITPAQFQLENKKTTLDSDEMIWYTLSTKLPGGIAAPVAKILKRLEKNDE